MVLETVASLVSTISIAVLWSIILNLWWKPIRVPRKVDLISVVFRSGAVCIIWLREDNKMSDKLLFVIAFLLHNNHPNNITFEWKFNFQFISAIAAY